jgi:hypothetical protein
MCVCACVCVCDFAISFLFPTADAVENTPRYYKMYSYHANIYGSRCY